MRSSKESFFPVMEVYEIFTVKVIIYLLSQNASPKGHCERMNHFLCLRIPRVKQSLNVIKFTHNITKPKVEREVNEGLGRQTRLPRSQGIWGCPVLANDISYSDKSIKSYKKKTITNTLHLHSAWQFSGSLPISILGWQCLWSLCQFNGEMETGCLTSPLGHHLPLGQMAQ